MKTLAAVAALVIVALSPAAAHAERAVGITGTNRLVSFDTLSPGTASVKAMTGFQAPDERTVGLDVRPATGELMAITVPIGSTTNAQIRTYRLDPSTATITLVGSVPASSIAGAGDRATGIDFNPLVDRLRIVQANNESFRISPSSGGLAGDDDNLTYSAPATGPVTGIAYDRNVAPGPPGTVPPATSKTTAYGIDTGSTRLVLIGSIDGSPISPNTGQVTAVGQLNVPVQASSDAGFDISPTGVAFATLSPAAGMSNLYSINLATGAATDLGPLPGVVGSLALLPPDNCPGVTGDNQADMDSDGIGDACDPDIDGDGIPNASEEASGGNPRSTDSDGDGKGDGADACPTLAAATANGCPDATGATPPPATADTTAPTVTVSGLAKKLKFAKFLKGVSLKVSPSEASAFEVELIVKASRANVAKAGDLVLAVKSLARAAGQRSVTLKPNKKLLGGKKKFTVTVRVTATDAAGNRRVATRKVSVTK
jgi:hypothetical protein